MTVKAIDCTTPPESLHLSVNTALTARKVHLRRDLGHTGFAPRRLLGPDTKRFPRTR